MSGASEESSGTMEGGSSEPMATEKDTYDSNKAQLESLKEIMMKNKQSLKKKEEDVQEYARRLSKIKSRAKLSRRSKEGATAPKDEASSPKLDVSATDTVDEAIDDISQAKTPKAKSSLLRKKLAENRLVFQQHNQTWTETKRAVEETVEAIRQQMDEQSLAKADLQKEQYLTPVRPIVVTSEVLSPIQLGDIQEKDNKIKELSNKILELEATIMDLQENLKEKDSVIDSKTKAVTLMSADLSKKGKTTLDTLEDTKDEMRTMQEHFVLLETSLRNKNDNLLDQLHGRENRILELEDAVKNLEDQLKEQKLAESTSADFSRSTMDTLVETKDAMKSMQENFVLIESSLKLKNENLLKQLQEYEVRLAEANERIFQLESGAGIVKQPGVEDLQIKLEKVEQANKQLQDEKYELQKSIAEMQNKIIASKSANNNGAIMEKDNRIAELENLIEELKRSNELLEEESKAELQKQVTELSAKNEEYSNKVIDLEKLVHDLETERNDIAARLSSEAAAMKEDDKVAQLTKELDELNKTLIKVKAQHRSKVKNLQKQLERFKMVSDANAEVVRLGNQVALLEEEKASAGDWQECIADLESKVSAQTKEIQMHIDAIATLENQKLDLTQELHMVKQEISALEAENAESENLRVTAEMKVVDLEEQLESLHKSQITEGKQDELLEKMEALKQENAELLAKLTKLEEKNASDAGSTESFETIHEDRNELLKKIEDLMEKNNELTLKLSKLEEKDGSHAGSTESFEAINDTDKNELLKKISQLTQENSDLMMKLSRSEEKGSSDTGSTESFERIPEHTEGISKIDLLTQENNDLVIKLTKLEEKLGTVECALPNFSKEGSTDLPDAASKIDKIMQELKKFTAQIKAYEEENASLQKRIDALTAENSDLVIKHTKLEEHLEQMKAEQSEGLQQENRIADSEERINVLIQEKESLEKELVSLREKLEDTVLKENTELIIRVTKLEERNENLVESLNKVMQEKNELQIKIDDMKSDEIAQERLELIDKLEKLNQEKESIARERQGLHEQISTLLHKSTEELSESRRMEESIQQQAEIEGYKKLIVEQTTSIEEMKLKLSNAEEELEKKTAEILDYQSCGLRVESLEKELQEMQSSIEEWKHKCSEIQQRMSVLEESKASIEQNFKIIQEENESLVKEAEQKKILSNEREGLEATISSLQMKLQEEIDAVVMKEQQIVALKNEIENKDQELHEKHTQLQNEMTVINNLRDELSNCTAQLQHKDIIIASLTKQVEDLNVEVTNKKQELHKSEARLSKLHEEIEESNHAGKCSVLMENLREKEMYLFELEGRYKEEMRKNAELMEEIRDAHGFNENVKIEIAQKEKVINELKAEEERLNAQLWDLQSIFDNSTKYVNNLEDELKNAYKQLERVKAKHVEDAEMQNRRLENIIEELNAKTQENDTLKLDLQEKNKIINESVPEEKAALEAKISSLEQKLTESENRIQAQREKMTKIAATLKKKTGMYQELEGRVAELERDLSTQKEEKEAMNRSIQEYECSIREKDNKIADLEQTLNEARIEATEGLNKSESLSKELNSAKEKISSLMEQIPEMNEEIEKLRAEAERLSIEAAMEKEAKQNILAEYESYKQQVIRENEQKEVVLDEVKENARELSVRMQVMEGEYVEQLALIKNLKAENGLLSSKQTQINEKLENVEKESEERRVLIEQLQKELAKERSTSQAAEDNFDEQRISTVQHCDRCEQYQTLVQALEAKLQEREAEIENLDNELANSISNFVQMRESSRCNELMRQYNGRNRNLEDPYNDLLFQFNALTSSNEEIKAKLGDTLTENKELTDKIESLQTLNATLEERINFMERELTQGNETKEQSIETLYSELLKKYNQQEEDLRNAQHESQSLRDRCNQIKQQLTQCESEKQNLLVLYKALDEADGNLYQEIQILKAEKFSYIEKIAQLQNELQEYQQRNKEAEPTTSTEPTASSSSKSEEKNNAPKLFDAFKIFGMSPGSDTDDHKETTRLQSLLNERDAECASLAKDLERLQKEIAEERSQSSENYNRCLEELRASQEQCREIQSELEGKSKQLDAMNEELGNNKLQSEMQDFFSQKENDEKLQEIISAKDKEIEELIKELNATKELLLKSEVELEQQGQHLHDLEKQISLTSSERDLLQMQVNDLTLTLEDTRESSASLRAVQQEIVNVTRERDEAKELAQQLTEALERLKVSSSDPVDSPIQKTAETSKRVAQLGQTPVADDNVLQEEPLATAWSSGSNDRLNVDEEGWGWNAECVQMDDQPTIAPLIPSAEVQLRAKIDELEDQIKDLQSEKANLIEENKTAQIKSGKYVKKLKEYKVQMESLQQQLKIQKSAGGFYELDSAIEDELKSQISILEKNIKELKEEQKNTLAEKEALLKRLDVLVSANERYMEMKERQDMDVEVLRIQNAELSNKVQALEWRLQEQESTDGNMTKNIEEIPPPETKQVSHASPEPKQTADKDLEAECKKYKEEIDELKDEMEALATENEQLQQYLEEQKTKIISLESKLNSNVKESEDNLERTNQRTIELQTMLDKSKEEYDILRKQYEQSLMDANDQVSVMRQNTELLKAEISARASNFEAEITDLQQQLQDSNAKIVELQKELQDSLEATSNLEGTAVELKRQLQAVSEEKESLEVKITDLLNVEQKFGTVNASLTEVTELLNARVQEVADLKQELQRQYVERQNVEVSLQNTIENINAELNDKKLELENLRQAFDAKENELIQQKSVETVSAIITEATQELVQKHAIELEEKDKEIRRLEQRLTSAQASAEEYNETRQELEKQLLDRQEVEGKLQATIDSLARELEERKQELNNVQHLLEMTENQLIEQNDAFNRVNQEIRQKHPNELQEKDMQIRDLTDRLAAVQQDMNHRSMQLQDSTASVDNQQQEIFYLKQELLQKNSEFESIKSNLQMTQNEVEEKRMEVESLQARLQETEGILSNLQGDTSYVGDLQKELETLKITLAEKQSIIEKFDNESTELRNILENNKLEMTELHVQLQQVDVLKTDVQDKTHRISLLSTELEQARKSLSEKESLLNDLHQKLNEKQGELRASVEPSYNSQSQIVDGLPLFRMGGNDDSDLQHVVDQLKVQVKEKQQEIDHLKHLLSENTYPRILQEMQDTINCLYNDKSSLEASLETATQTLAEKEKQMENLKHLMDTQHQEFVGKDEASVSTRDRRSLQTQEEIVRLQNDLHTKEQEINDLKYVIAEKDSQLSLQASMEPPSDDFELQETVQRLTAELYGKEQEIQHLKSMTQELQEEIMRLRDFEKLSQESKNAIQRLTSEKEQIRMEAEALLESKLREKEREIDEIKQRLSSESKKLLDEIALRNNNIEDLNKRLEESSADWNERLHQREEELAHVMHDLTEKERRLAEVSITKDAELHNLKVQIHDRDVRIEELLALSEDEEKQLAELRQLLDSKEAEINSLKEQLDTKIKEYELIQYALKKDVPMIPHSSESAAEGNESPSNELDLALYMLHQRDVRCEELTHELMQLLEERDTLQLRLSNAIRVNEELRRVASTDGSPKKDLSSSSGPDEPVVEHPSPSKSEGPVEIAKEAIDAPIGEDREALALKLSQLHTVGHARDVRLKDERELRHTQQMSLLAHKDVLSTLPPEAAARIVNANYTLSRDVQSQSSVLLNWLWGKSTPKVVHM